MPEGLVADQGREFISHELAEFCAGHSIFLWYCGVGAPWQNGICERAGGTLRLILASGQCTPDPRLSELEEALGEPLGAYNSNVNEFGVSPSQAALGRQPRMTGDVLKLLPAPCRTWAHRLQSFGGSPQLALRETARAAMTR